MRCSGNHGRLAIERYSSVFQHNGYFLDVPPCRSCPKPASRCSAQHFYAFAAFYYMHCSIIVERIATEIDSATQQNLSNCRNTGSSPWSHGAFLSIICWACSKSAWLTRPVVNHLDANYLVRSTANLRTVPLTTVTLKCQGRWRSVTLLVDDAPAGVDGIPQDDANSR